MLYDICMMICINMYDRSLPMMIGCNHQESVGDTGGAI